MARTTEASNETDGDREICFIYKKHREVWGALAWGSVEIRNCNDKKKKEKINHRKRERERKEGKRESNDLVASCSVTG